jgi:flagellar basal-body rod modification protein FlgD
MQVNGTNSPNGTNTVPVPGSAAAATLDYNSFLRLLVAEMKNQDPTKPNDSTQYMAQLASFSNVEQAIKTNNKLDALLTASALNQADGLIGRMITSADGAITGKVTAIKIISGGAVAILEGDKQVPIEPGVVVKAS